MQILLAGHAGFCSGVRRALDAALKEAARGRRVHTLGPLVHNEAVGDYLARHGVTAVAEPEQAAGAVLIIRTHGVGPAVLERARRQDGLTLLDVTCPRVEKIQRLASELAAKGVQVIVYGDARHPEVRGVLEWAGERAVAVSSAEELNRLDIEAPAALLAQTTADSAGFEQVKAAFLDRVPGGAAYDTLCPETKLRQREAAALARKADAVVVVGSAHSANTRAMVEICKQLKPTCLVLDAGELAEQFWQGCRVVAVTAGASTPHWTIKEVVERMENEGFVAGNEEQFTYESGFKAVQIGEQVTGKVVRVTPDEAFVDIGYKTEALLPVSEVYLGEGETLPERFAVDTEIEVTVIDVDEQDGKIVVSHKRLAREKRWQELEQAHLSGAIEEGPVKQVVPAGIVVDLGGGIEGFMPGSLVDIRFVPDFKTFLGERLPFKIIEYNREKDKVILSRKKVLEEDSSRKKEETLQTLKIGSVVPGVVKRLTDFGAFVDIGGIDGLVHVSEIAWERVTHPQAVLKVGEEVQVKVLDIIPEKGRISLSLRQTQAGPWVKALQEFKKGQLIKGKVTRIVNFGAFVELKPGVEGLVHVSQIADYHVKHPSEVLREGEKVDVKILDVKPEAKRISLSIKDAVGKEAPEGGQTPGNTDNGNLTLGDLFGDMFETNAPEKEEREDGSSAPQEPGVLEEDDRE